MSGISGIGFSPMRPARLETENLRAEAMRNAPLSTAYNPDQVFDEDIPPTLALDPALTEGKRLHQRGFHKDPALAGKLAAEMIRAHLSKSLGREAEEKLDRLRQRLAEKGGGGKAAMLQAASEEFEDVSDQYLALLCLLREYEESEAGGDAAGESRQMLEEALAELEEAQGEDVRAGIHCLGVLPEFSPPEEVAAFRTLYRESLDVAGDLRSLLTHLMKDGAADLDGAALRLRQAVADDLASGWPSREPGLLHALTSQLYRLEVINSVRDSCRNVAEHMQRQFARTVPADELLKETVDLAQDSWAGAARFESLADRFASGALALRISFLVEIKGLIRDLPVKIFSTPENRIQLVDSVQGALDRAIEQEDASL